MVLAYFALMQVAENKRQNHIPSERIILGIDPGTVQMGYGVLEIAGKELKVLTLGVIHLNKFEDHYMRLQKIYERVLGIITEYLPDEMAIEAPFYGANVQTMLKLGRAQGVAMAAAISRQVPVTEYAPTKVKMSITGNGASTKDQVAYMLEKTLTMPPKPHLVDATDALAVALCHHYQGKNLRTNKANSWSQFLKNNPERKG